MATQLAQVQEDLADAILETLAPGEDPVTVTTDKGSLTVTVNFKLMIISLVETYNRNTKMT